MSETSPRQPLPACLVRHELAETTHLRRAQAALGRARLARQPLRARIPRRAGAQSGQPADAVGRARRLRHAAPEDRLARHRARPREPREELRPARPRTSNCAAPAGSTSIREKLVVKAQRNGIVGGHHIGTTRMSVDPKRRRRRPRLPRPRRRQPLCRQRFRLSDLRPGQPDAHAARTDLPAGRTSRRDPTAGRPD